MFDRENINTSLTLANINWEFSKYLIHIGKKSLFDIYFKAAVKLFYANSFDLPYRVHYLGRKMAANSDCFCGSTKKYSECHQNFFKSNYHTQKTRKIEVRNIQENSRVSIFMLKEHKNQWDITSEDYGDFYEMVSSESTAGTYSMQFNSKNDIPVILRVDTYGKLPKIIEFILREYDISISLENLVNPTGKL